MVNKEFPKPRELSRLAAAVGVPHEFLEKFTELARMELMGLHEGSLLKYQLTPIQFEEWKTSVTRLVSSSASQVFSPVAKNF